MNDFIPISGISQAWQRTLPRFEDSRGFFYEEFRESDAPVSLPRFVQDNISYSRRNILRGMHVQVDQWQLITVLSGELNDVLVDISPASSTYLNSISLALSSSNVNQLLLRPGIAHGYVITSNEALIHYKSSVYYGDTPQFGYHWNSRGLRRLWPSGSWIVSERDSEFPELPEPK